MERELYHTGEDRAWKRAAFPSSNSFDSEMALWVPCSLLLWSLETVQNKIPKDGVVVWIGMAPIDWCVWMLDPQGVALLWGVWLCWRNVSLWVRALRFKSSSQFTAWGSSCKTLRSFSSTMHAYILSCFSAMIIIKSKMKKKKTEKRILRVKSLSTTCYGQFTSNWQLLIPRPLSWVEGKHHP